MSKLIELKETRARLNDKLIIGKTLELHNLIIENNVLKDDIIKLLKDDKESA